MAVILLVLLTKKYLNYVFGTIRQPIMQKPIMLSAAGFSSIFFLVACSKKLILGKQLPEIIEGYFYFLVGFTF